MIQTMDLSQTYFLTPRLFECPTNCTLIERSQLFVVNNQDYLSNRHYGFWIDCVVDDIVCW